MLSTFFLCYTIHMPNKKKKKSENAIVKVIRNIYLPQLLRTSHICWIKVQKKSKNKNYYFV